MNGHGREPTVFWAFGRRQGAGRSIAGALILMSDWCGFVPTQMRENLGADAPSAATYRTQGPNSHYPVVGLFLPVDTEPSNE